MKKILLCLCLFWVACDNSTEPDNCDLCTELEGSWTGINTHYADNLGIENTYTFVFTENNCEMTGALVSNNGTVPVIGSSIFITNTEVEPNQVDMTIISYEIDGEPMGD